MLRNFAKAMLRAVLKLAFRVRVQGDLRDARRAPLLVIANHESFLDGVMLALFLPIDPVFVVHTGVTQSPFFRLVLSQVDHLSVDPTSPMAMRKVLRLLETGRPVAIFPEGRITVTGSLMKVYDGPAFVAARSGATVLPVRLDGPARSYFSRLSGKYPKRLFPRVTVTVLPGTRIEMPAEGKARDRRRKAGEAMRKIMQDMLFRSRPEQTLYSAVLDAMSIQGRGYGIIEDVKRIEYSYGELLKMTLALARMASKVTCEREHVGVLMPNLAATLCLILGLGALRRVPALLNYTAGTEGMQSACVAARIDTIVTSRKFLETAKIESKVAQIVGPRIVYLEDLQPALGLADKLWILLHTLLPRRLARALAPEDPAVVLFTSGSEGKPKGVVLSHRAILANIAQIRAVIPFSTDDKIFNALPVFHSFGLTAGGLLALVTGTRLFLYVSPLHYRVIPELAYDRNCSVLFGTSTFLGAYARFAHPYDFFRLRYVVAGAEKLSESVRSLWFEKFGIRILEGYGATETAPVLAVNTPMACRTGTVGQLLPAIESRLVPVPGVERGGVLHVRGPNLMSGYYRYEHPGRLEAPSSSIGEGWYDTGDIVEIDEDGFLSIVGRAKRFVKIAGEMVSLEVVERIAQQARPDATHAATARADPQRGETIVLFTTADALERESLLAAARAGGLPEIAVPKRVVTVKELPVLGTGKVDYVRLEELALEA